MHYHCTTMAAAGRAGAFTIGSWVATAKLVPDGFPYPDDSTKALLKMTLSLTPYLTLDPEAHRNRQELYDAMRAEKIVHHDPVTGMYLVCDPDAIREILMDGDSYSSVDAFSPALTAASAYMMTILTEEQKKHFVTPTISVMTSDGPTHRRLRRILNSFFTTTAIRSRHKGMYAAAGEILDGLSGTVDWVDDFCTPLTTHTIVDLIGVPDTEFDTIGRWNMLLADLATGVNVTPNTIAEYIAFTKEFTEYFREQADRTRKNPGPGLFSHLLGFSDELTELELIQLLLIVFPAGTLTTQMLLTHIAGRLAEEPGLIEQLRTNPDAIPEFIEDSVIKRSPTATLFRTTLRPTTVLGTEIPAGATVMAMLVAANQDIQDVQRHLAFGYGAHSCIGAPLARQEVAAALDAILERYDSFTLAQPLDQLPVHPHLFFPAFPHLYLEMHRRKSSAA